MIFALTALNKYWCRISFSLKIFFLEYMIGLWGWCMKYHIPCLRARNTGSSGSFIYPLNHMVGYWRPECVRTVLYMRPPTHLLRDPPYQFSIIFFYSLIWGLAMKSYVSNDVSIGKCYFWNFTSYFVFVLRYSWMMFLSIQSFWSMQMLYLLWMVLILSSFNPPPHSGSFSWIEYQVLVSVFEFFYICVAVRI